MLYIDYKIPYDKVVQNPSMTYDAFYKISWFEDPEVIRIACEIDNLKHFTDDIFESDFSGRCSGKDISGGAKTVILAYLGVVKDYALPLSWLGENCFPTLGSLKIKDDIVFDADSSPGILDFKCRFISKRTGKVIDNFIDYASERVKYVFKD